MISLLKKIINYLLILFIMVLAFNCAEGKQEENNNEKGSEAEASFSGSDIQTPFVIDAQSRSRNETPEDYQIRVAGKNNVKNRTAVNFLYDLKGKLNNDGAVSEEVEFDKKGRKIKHVLYMGTNKINFIWLFKYDNNDNLVEFNSYDENNILLQKKVLSYNKVNKITESNEIYPTRNNQINYKYIYNESGLLIETKGNNSKGISTSEKRSYNSSDRIESILSLSHDGTVVSNNKLEYDNRGNIIKEIYKDSNNNEMITTYEGYNSPYPEQVNMPIQKKVYKYDSKGNVLLEMMYNSDGGRQYKYKNEYDEKGLITKRTRYDALDKPALIIKYEYSFYN